MFLNLLANVSGGLILKSLIEWPGLFSTAASINATLLYAKEMTISVNLTGLLLDMLATNGALCSDIIITCTPV